VGLRRGRRPVSPLAIDYRRQTNLPKHVGAVSRCVQANDLEVALLVTTDGFKFYQRVIGRTFGPACHYVQVMKTRQERSCVSVERAVIGREGLGDCDHRVYHNHHLWLDKLSQRSGRWAPSR